MGDCETSTGSLAANIAVSLATCGSALGSMICCTFTPQSSSNCFAICSSILPYCQTTNLTGPGLPAGRCAQGPACADAPRGRSAAPAVVATNWRRVQRVVMTSSIGCDVCVTASDISHRHEPRTRGASAVVLLAVLVALLAACARPGASVMAMRDIPREQQDHDRADCARVASST